MEGGHDEREAGSKLAIVAVMALLCLAYVFGAFWYGDVRYSLPTPRPEGLIAPPIGATLPVDRWLASVADEPEARPVLLHFFNPDCACTRFNVAHVRSLHERFGDRARFVGVVQTDHEGEALEEALSDLDLGIPLIIDRRGRIAAEAGVYSTPQAVLTNGARELLYRGNYNVSRYCTDPSTEFARIALESLFAERVSAVLPETLPYGCSLPDNP